MPETPALLYLTACQGLNERTQPHNSTWTTPDGCVKQCTDGVVIIIDVDCPKPPRPDCSVIEDQDRCCPIYHCPTAEKGGHKTPAPGDTLPNPH